MTSTDLQLNPNADTVGGLSGESAAAVSSLTAEPAAEDSLPWRPSSDDAVKTTSIRVTRPIANRRRMKVDIRLSRHGLYTVRRLSGPLETAKEVGPWNVRFQHVYRMHEGKKVRAGVN